MSDQPQRSLASPPEGQLWCTKGEHYAPRESFYDNPRGREGKSSWCKRCMHKRAKRLRYQQKNYRSAETLARRAVNNALKKGIIKRPAGVCFWCGNVGRLEANHYKGYAQEHWLTIEWACHSCHNILEFVDEGVPEVDLDLSAIQARHPDWSNVYAKIQSRHQRQPANAGGGNG